MDPERAVERERRRQEPPDPDEGPASRLQGLQRDEADGVVEQMGGHIGEEHQAG